MTNATGNDGPASSAIWPVNARMPAPITTPVPIATVPVRLRLPARYAELMAPPAQRGGRWRPPEHLIGTFWRPARGVLRNLMQP